MRGTTKGALFLLALGVVAVVVWKLLMPMLFERGQRSTSDATGSSIDIRIGGDNYLGYWFINSPQMIKMAARKGINIQFTDDGGVYSERLKKFNEGEYECIVLPVNSYLQHGQNYKYPGVIVAAISESQGADGIIGYNMPSTDVNSLNDAGLTFVYIPDSPSSFLIDLLIDNFGLNNLKTSKTWRMEVNSLDEVYKSAKEGKGNVYVTWEPNLTRIDDLEGMSYIFGSDNFKKYIIDVFVFRREFIKEHEDKVIQFFQVYYQVLRSYASNKQEMLEGMSKSTKIKEDRLEDLIKKVEWFDLSENCNSMFGISTGASGYTSEGIVDCIIACTGVMLNAGTFDSDPLGGDPYLIINSSILEELSKTSTIAAVGTTANGVDFEALTDEQWKKLPQVGVFKVMDITFQSWNNSLSPEGSETVDKTASMLVNNYPEYRIIIRGHTQQGGDEELNVKNSLERAQVVAQRLIAVYNIDPNRIKAEGVGSSVLPTRNPGESSREWRYRQARVEFIAVRENPF